MKLLAALIILTIFACAALASHQRKPFPLRIDAQARNVVNRPMMFVCKPAIFTLGPDAPKPIVRT